MDLVASFAKQLGINEQQAQAVAGTVLGTVREQVASNVGPDASAKLDAAVPELPSWQQKAAALLGGGAAPATAPAASAGGLGGLMAGLSGGAGGSLLGAIAGKEAQQTAALVGLLGQLGVEPSKAVMAAPLALSFLRERLPAEWIERAMQAAPLLAGAASGTAPAAASPSAAGVAGDLLGKLWK